jgi:DNA-directed RNA polymerase subunit RPC12/RpoP
MSPLNQIDRDLRGRQRAHSSHNRAIYDDISSGNGVPIRCQHCSHQSFRRSSLRATDFSQIFFMRYPVRCLRCGQRQMVSFTVAGISLPSSTKPQKFEVPTSKHWTEPPGDSSSYPSRPNDRAPRNTEDTEV